MIITGNQVSQARARHQALYDFIRSFKIDNSGKSPTVRELCSFMGIGSTSLVVYYLENLEDQGVLKLGKSRSARHIELVGESYTAPEPVEIR